MAVGGLLGSLAKLNQSGIFSTGKLWEGTPISDLLIGKAEAAGPSPSSDTPTFSSTDPNPSGRSATVIGGTPSYQTTGSTGASNTNNSILDQIGNNTRNVYEDQLNSARSLYDQRAAELNNQLGSLGREKDTMLDRIGATYRGLVDTANQTLTKNLGLLEGRKGEVQQTYDVGRTNAARLLGDEQRMNRQLARAQNLLSSGYYTNLQNQAGRSATERIAGLNTEEMSKLDAIGSSIVNAQTDTNTKIQALQEEQGLQEAEVTNKYMTLANAIRNDLRFNEKDKLDALGAVNNRMASALDGINMAFMQYQAMAGNLGNVASTQRSAIESYDPFAAIQNTLSMRTAQDAAYQPVKSALSSTGAQTASSPIGYYNFDNNRQRSRLDDLFA